jgi:septum formation protein
VAERPLVLASSSPRRIELLRAAGYRFSTIEPAIDERAAGRGLDVHHGVVAIATAKAMATAVGVGTVVIGADTVVLCAGQVLGKPKDRGHARAFLTLQSGQLVTVLSAVVVRHDDGVLAETCSTQLTMRRLSGADIEQYLDTGEADDKAGALAVQGAARPFVTDISGSWTNVLGLPMESLEPLLAAAGVSR